LLFISPPGFSGQAYVLLLLLSFFFSFFNDCLEQRGLRNYKPDLQQMFRGGKYLDVDVHSWYWFRDRLRDIAMAINFRRKIGRNRQHAFLLGTRIPQWMAVWKSGWAR